MYELTVTSSFAAAHALRNFSGKCENLHGHNWRVKARVVGDKLDEAGMLIDFGVLKKKLNAILDNELDHRHLNDLDIFAGASPSSENIARYIYDRLAAELAEDMVDNGAGLAWVSVWESENSQATYRP